MSELKAQQPAAGQKIVEAVAADPVVQAAVEHAADPGVLAGARAAAVAIEDAAVLETAGVRDAAVLKAQGRREETVLRTGSQRRINLIWEVTQAIVTVMVVGATLFIAGSLVVKGDPNAAAAFLLLSNAFFMIVTAYYQRTNHTRTGGVGGQDVETDR